MAASSAPDIKYILSRNDVTTTILQLSEKDAWTFLNCIEKHRTYDAGDYAVCQDQVDRMSNEMFCAFVYAVNQTIGHRMLYYRDAKGRLTDAYISICYPRDLYATVRPQHIEACMFGPSSDPDPINKAIAQRFGEVPRRERLSDTIHIDSSDRRMTSEITRDQMDLVVESVMRADAAGQYDIWKRQLFGDDGDQWMLDCVMNCTQRTNPGPVYGSEIWSEIRAEIQSQSKTNPKYRITGLPYINTA
jgi:hypothetical protein